MFEKIEREVRIVVAGSYYYAGRQAYARGDLFPGARLVLKPEPDNPYDSNAVGVRIARTDEMLGHLPAEHAPRYRSIVAAGTLVSCILVSATTTPHRRGGDKLRIEIAVRYLDAPSRQVSGTASQMAALPDQPGVYCLTNSKSGRTYIGSSVDIRDRAKKHFNDLRAGSHANRLLQSDFHSQKGEGFAVSVVERCSATNWREAEKRWVTRALQEGRPLYNMTADGEGRVPNRGHRGVTSISDREGADVPAPPSPFRDATSIRTEKAAPPKRPPSPAEANSGSGWTIVGVLLALILLLVFAIR